MAENHLEYGYLEGESIGEHFAEDPELAAIKARVQELEMEEETERLKEEEDRCDAVDMQLLTSSPRPGPFYNMTPEERIDADNRSVYVGNTMELLQMSWRSISMAVVLSTELPSCVTGSPGIPRALLTLNSLIETLCRVLLVCMRLCSEEESLRFCPRGPTCQESAPQTGEDTEVATPEAEAVVTVHPATITALEVGSGTSPPGRNIKHPTLTTAALQWGRDSGDTWTTTNRCLNVTHVFFSSPRLQRSWARDRVDSTTLNSASTTHSIHTTQVGD
uniref:embryonic polyadenylate-binding protein 2 isoform X2 n=1 Tax=Epinephelus lanceolatus TaxID=310571 RepID=UPI0014487238|nr:embryonic polyadenylate-binding protein 2 isoform X2 [Epinephelus lanceolatus]